MTYKYEKKIQKNDNRINKEDNNFRENKQIYKSIADGIFGEKNTIYIR
ncbi:hypothetical protein L9Z42_14670 [Clostridioides difficile]|nr:hypothetical protein [Clostridioides difficile]